MATPDLHITKAAEFFGIPAAEVTPEQRSAGKRLNYLEAYGSSLPTGEAIEAAKADSTSMAADIDFATGEARCNEVTAMPARAATAPAEQVSLAISPAISPASDENYKSESKGNQSGNQASTGNVSAANCYKCKHRRSVPGNAHIQCAEPAVEAGGVLLFPTLLKYGEVRATVKNSATGETKSVVVISADHWAIRKGYFAWPMLFDPGWLKVCLFYEPQEEQTHAKD